MKAPILYLSLLLSLMCAISNAQDGQRYSVVILGDTHFDAEPDSVYHSCYDEKVEWLNRVQRAEFARNGEMWRDRCPRMLERASRLVSADTKFILQTGDLIQGDCGNPAVHRQMLDDVMNSFKASFGGLPFVTVEGNHDIRGTGAKDVYHSYMPQRMSQELGKEIHKTTFSFSVGQDTYIVVDFNHPDVEEIKKLLQASEGSRYTFIICHGSIFPSDMSSCRWFLLGKEEYTQQRRELKRLFAQHNVICLCGHTHSIEVLDWYGDDGRITQMNMNSVWSKESLSELTVISDTPSQYGTQRGKLKNDDGSEIKNESELFAEYACGIKRYYQAKGAGSFKMDVSDKRIAIDFYGGDSNERTARYYIR